MAEFSDSTLDRAAERMLTALIALHNPRLASRLRDNGLTDEDVAESSALVAKLLPNALPYTPATDEVAAGKKAAIDEASGLDELFLLKYKPLAAVKSPKSTDWIFQGLSSESTAARSIRVVQTVLTRLDAIESGEAPPGLDPCVLDELARRGLDKAERTRIQGLVKSALGELPPGDAAEGWVQPMTEEELLFAKTELHRRWLGFSGIAKTAKLKRGELIQLGLANRRKAADDPDPDDGQ